MGAAVIVPGQLLINDCDRQVWVYEKATVSADRVMAFIEESHHYCDSLWLVTASVVLHRPRRYLVYIISDLGHGGWCVVPSSGLRELI